MIHISLFSGIGGFEIAAERVGWTNGASCEINDFGHQVLSFHFPHAYHHRDVKTLTYQIINDELTKRFGPDWRSNGIILSGGFPCQPASVAGQRRGTDDDRWLWPQFERLIDEIKPDWVCGENVTGILSMEDKSGIYRDVFAKVEGRKITRFPEIDYYEAIYIRQSKLLVGSICESLEKRGYEVQTFAIPAAAVEAPHKRERIWFVANRNSVGRRPEPQHCGVQRKGSWNKFKRGDTEAQHIDANSTNAGIETMRCERKNPIHEPGFTPNPGFERQAWTEQRTTGAVELCESGLTSHPIGNDAGRYRHGETGHAPRHVQIVKEKRQRVRAVIKRIGCEESFANANQFHGRLRAKGKNWKEVGDCCKSIVTNAVSHGSGKSLGGKQSKLINQDDKAKGNDANPGSTGRQELNIPGFAAKPGHGNRFDNAGSGGRFVNFPNQSPVCGRNDGLSAGLDNITFSKWRNESIKGFGNAVVPAVVYEIFSAIEKYRIFEASP